MIVHRLEAAPPPSLSRALAEFEGEFSYPLGPGGSFRITHGEDYPRFFRAIGRAGCFVAQSPDGRVVGTFATVIRRLGLPDGGEQPVAYLADLKVTAGARGGRALYRLARAAHEWVARAVQAGFSVVMDGTAATPDRYTGRAGLPSLTTLATITILRLAPQATRSGPALRVGADPETGEQCYRALSRGRYFSPGGRPQERSELAPVWLVDRDGRACGRLEDTRTGKRLLTSDGAELVSAHLSCFAFGEVAAGAALLCEAARRAADLGYPALFAAVASADARLLGAALGGAELTVAPATVYGTGLEAGREWHVNTAEI